MNGRISPASLGLAPQVNNVNDSPSEHIRQRIEVSYAYGLILRNLVAKKTIPMRDITNLDTVGATIQAPRGRGLNIQQAHQIMAEACVFEKGDQYKMLPVYLYPKLSDSERGALIYAASAVSSIHKKYNEADLYLENDGRVRYIRLLKDFVRRGPAPFGPQVKGERQSLLGSVVLMFYRSSARHLREDSGVTVDERNALQLYKSVITSDFAVKGPKPSTSMLTFKPLPRSMIKNTASDYVKHFASQLQKNDKNKQTLDSVKIYLRKKWKQQLDHH